ncbi:MAG: Ig-like domain-containing protein [Actinomycetota bacterium]|nr:Ig-like domain-containing protein [Actinomycetota bacterium]
MLLSALTLVASLTAPGSTASAAGAVVSVKPAGDVAVEGVQTGAGASTGLWQQVDDGTSFASSDNDATKVTTVSGRSGAHTVSYAGVPSGPVSQVVANVRAMRTKFASSTMTVRLYDGATLIGTAPARALGTSYANYSETFGNLNVANGNNLRTRVELTNTSSRGTAVYTEIWLDVTQTTTTTPVDAPPTVQIGSPANGSGVSGTVSITGTAADDASVSRVDVKVDGGVGQAAAGTANWSYSWNTSGLSGSHTITAVATDSVGQTATASITVSVVASTPPATTGVADLLSRTDLIYGSEIGAWKTTGAPATDPSTGIPALVQAAKIPVVRYSVYDVFTDMRDPLGNPGTQSRANFDTALNSIRGNLNAEVMIKLLPISNDVIGTKNGSIYCPPLGNLTQNLEYYKAVVAQAGSRVRIYESSNEMEYDCAAAWGFASAGSPGVSRTLGQHFAQNMPALKKYARSLGFDIVTVGYIGTPGGFGWGDSIANPRISTAVEFLTATHDAYVASGYDPDYIPDAISIHAYPFSPDFGYNASLSDIISYYESWQAKVRAQINSIWGPTIGPSIRMAVSEWNAGEKSWTGFSDQRVVDFYNAWLAMLRRGNYWLANQFAIGSNGTEPYDMIKATGATTPYYYAFKTNSTGTP